ncbi:MAG: DUF255 domain-containing protein [Alphaproteobacteria bacterium]|nr:DUF255 domain-containing protein [Alphaproteobacteria bacterium]
MRTMLVRVLLAAALLLLLVIAMSWSVGVSVAEPASRGGPQNRLASEASPYLRQHARNPVDWHPWGEEAFAKARAEGKPIFLSVGYATCHWCHVMARESFMDEEIAALLNKHVVSIKVDRERHPEVDQTYMLATELITQSGGWPNSLFLTPDLKPFYAATYIPPADFNDLIVRLAEVWTTERAALEADAERVAAVISRVLGARIAAKSIALAAMAKARDDVLADLDSFNGGLGVAPKFPREPVLLHLLDRAAREGPGKALEAAILTLDHVLAGGINDQLAGGFHRYAVDNAWVIPHFEKMLYNQALMTQALVRAYQVTGAPGYAVGARRTLEFVLAEMTAPDGGFYSALDAESEGREGAYYVWTPEEMRAVLGPDTDLAIKAFGVTKHGNLDGRTVLHRPLPDADLAAAAGLDRAALEAKLNDIVSKLSKARSQRPRPARDEKILSGWNGAMIAAFAEAGRVLEEPRYIAAAATAARFVLAKMGGEADGLKRSFFEGHADLEATQVDHVQMALGLIALFDATGERAWLDQAIRLSRAMIAGFLDEPAGDFFMASSGAGFVRAKQRDDSELASGNAAALELFARLARRDTAPEWRHHADRLAAIQAVLAVASPVANAHALTALTLLVEGEMGPLQFAGKGAVRIGVTRDGGAVLVRLAIAPGWHVNADKPLEDFLIPTRLGLAGGAPAEVAYPKPITRKLSFNGSDMTLYEGDVELRLTPAGATGGAMELKLELQTCSDQICLDPETLTLAVGPVDGGVGR